MFLTIRKASEEDFPRVINFLNSSQSIGHQKNTFQYTKEVFEWEFLCSPEGEAIFVIAEDNVTKEILGTLAAMPYRLIDSNEKEVLTGKSESIFVSLAGLRKHKRRDILKEMNIHLEQLARQKGYQFIWGFSYSIAANHKINLLPVSTCLLGILLFKTKEASKLWLSQKGVRKTLARLKLFIAAIISRSKLLKIRRCPYRMECDQSNYFTPQMPPNTYFLKCSQQYKEWRLYNNPSQYRYSILSFYKQNDQQLAEIVVGQKETIGFIEMMHFAACTPREKTSMLKRAILFLRKQYHVELIRFMGSTHHTCNVEEIKLCKRVGFFFPKGGMSFLFKPLYPQYKGHGKNIHVSSLMKEGIQ